MYVPLIIMDLSAERTQKCSRLTVKVVIVVAAVSFNFVIVVYYFLGREGLALKKTRKIAMAETKKSFDLEVIQERFTKCKRDDGSIGMDDYIEGYTELTK